MDFKKEIIIAMDINIYSDSDIRCFSAASFKPNKGCYKSSSQAFAILVQFADLIGFVFAQMFLW